MLSLLNMHCTSKRNIFIAAFCFFVSLLTVSPLFSQVNKADAFIHLYAQDAGVQKQPTEGYVLAINQQPLPAFFKIIRQLDDHAAIVLVQDQKVFSTKFDSTQFYPANDEWKWSPSFATSPRGAERFIVSALKLDALKDKLAANAIPISRADVLTGSVVIQTSLNIVKKILLPDPNIIFIDAYVRPQAEVGIIGYNRSFHGISAIDHSMPAVNGKDIVVGVKEQKMEAADLDLYQRVLASPLADADVEMHATMISSIIGGAGNSFYDGRGIAWGCEFFPSSFDNLFVDDATILNNNAVYIQNHSYGTIVQQFYGAEALGYDISTWQNKERLHIFSAGNRGLQASGEGPYAGIAGFANLTGNFKMAKNIVAVAAVDNRQNIIAESSSGPAYDGRMVPQLTALGPSGTSDAAAMVSGASALLQQVYKDSNANQLPAASLVKTLLYNNAVDIGKAGIDHKTGFGLLNALAAVQQLQQKHYYQSLVGHQQEWTQTLNIPSGIENFKVTLAWTDSAASLNNIRALANDLDLSVERNSDASIYLPWVLNTAAHIDSLNKPASRGRDSVNTAEQVSVRLPAAGLYTLRVRGARVVNNAVPFSVSYTLDTLNRFYFTSPQHSSDVNRQENPDLFVRWKTAVADTNTTGNLYISYDRGVQWQLVQSNHKIYQNKFIWPIKDTSSTAQFRMQTGFGDFFSKEFIISPVCRPQVDFYCADSFRLSWPKHVYANNYKVWVLTDSPYLKHMLTVADSFLVLNRNAYPRLVYAVEPVPANGIPATRSIAMDISLQGVKCFYKTFYHELLNDNELELNIELSAPEYIDSIHFEQVSSNGMFLRNVGSARVVSSQALHQQLVDELLPGSSYWRVRLVLKSGAIVYTETISVLSTGKKLLLLYPNPASRETALQFLVKQGYRQGSSLMLYDGMGRLLKQYGELPNSIDVSRMAPGVIFYRLIFKGKVLENGKFMIY